MKWLNNISIKSRVLNSFFLILFLFIAFGIFSLHQMRELFHLTQKLYDHPFTVSNAAQRANTGVIRMHRTMKDISSSSTTHQFQQSISEVQAQERLVYDNLNIVKNNILGAEGKKLVQEAIDMFSDWKPIRNEVKELVFSGHYSKAHLITIKKGANYVDKLERKMMDLSNHAHLKASGFLKDAASVWKSIAILIIILILAIAGIFIFILTVVLKSINTNINKLADTMALFHTTGKLEKAEVIGANEISDLSIHFNNLIKRLDSQVWLRDGLNSLNEELSGDLDYTLLLNKGVTFISKYIEACVGAIYTYSEKDKCSTLATSYAFVERRYISNQFKNGEGIIGQVALEKQPILLKNIQRNEAEAISGTIAEPPKHIYALPLIYEDSLLGVLEIASFNKIDNKKREIMDEFGKIMSTFAHTARQNQRVQDLFKITQKSNQDLEVKTEELNITNERLSGLNDELQVQADELRVQQKELEMQRHQVKEADRLKSEFLSNMSHELRTPLNSVLALSQLMIRQGTGKEPEKEHEYLNVIERNGRRLLSLINDILDLSKIEAGRVELELSEFNTVSLLTRVLETASPLVNTDNVSLDLNYESDLRIYSDEEKVQQIMLNLVSNAIKFTDKGSIVIEVFKKDNWICCSIQDTGIGIGADEITNIFSEFRQVDGSMSRRHEGTGLGLAISQKLAHKLGGNISVVSKLGKGSIFTLQLPSRLNPKIRSSWQPVAKGLSANISKPEDSEWINSLKQKGYKPIILVIDDDEAIRQYLREHLTKAGYNVFTATNGKDGLLYAKTLRPSLITLDILMPEMDGFEVIRELKQNEVTEKTPVMMVSVSDDKETGMALGASRFLTKPLDYKKLLTQINLMVPGKLSPKILMVDDDPIVRQQLTDLLNEYHYQTETVKNGMEAVKIIAATPPDMLILDLMMPEMDGFSVLQKIRSNPKTKELPVLILTAKDLTKQEREKLAKSVHNVLAKGNVDNSTLMNLVQETIRKLPPKEFITEKKPVLLVVEDNEIAALQVQSILKEEEYSFLMAGNELEAYKILKNNVPDAVILNLMKPETDGFQVLKKLRLTTETKNTPVLVLTTKKLTEKDRAQLVYNNIQELIRKDSVNKEQLLAAINSLFNAENKKITTPDSSKNDPAEQKRKSINKKPADCTLLIVEDNPDNLVSIEAILDILGYNYISAADGQEALNVMRSQNPDLVLMDIQLPLLNGIDALQLIRKDPKLAEIPVISLTAKAMKGDKEKLLSQGFDDYISKPINPDEVRTILKKWTGIKQNP